MRIFFKKIYRIESPLFWASSLIGFAILSASCSSPKIAPTTQEEKIEKRADLGRALFDRASKSLKILPVPDGLTAYLEQVTYFLQYPHLRAVSQKERNRFERRRDTVKPTVRAIEDTRRGTRVIWSAYSFPVLDLFVSRGYLKACETENELAAVLAFQLAHLRRQDLTQKILNEISSSSSDIDQASELEENTDLIKEEIGKKDMDFFSESGLFSYSEKTLKEAREEAIGILYSAGYDPRGAVKILGRAAQRKALEAWELESAPRALEGLKKKVIARPPIRNPIVSTPEFKQAKSWIQSL